MHLCGPGHKATSRTESDEGLVRSKEYGILHGCKWQSLRTASATASSPLLSSSFSLLPSYTQQNRVVTWCLQPTCQ